MKIAHISDIHLSEMTGPIKDGKNARMMDTINCMDYAANELLREQPDVILIAGDLFHKSKLWADEMLKEITIVADWLRDITMIAPTVLMFGTANHDNIKAFENIRAMRIHNLKVVIDKPQLLNIDTKSGLIQIAAVPGMDKGEFRTHITGLDKEDENKAISEILGSIVKGLYSRCNKDIPSVLIAHYTVAGCELENGESIFLNSDVVLPTEALQASDFDLVCLGHIHKAQLVPNCGRPTFYSGPLNGITFNEEGQDKGFWIHDIDTDIPFDNIDSRFVKTPSREFLTLNWDEYDVKNFINSNFKAGLSTNIENKIIRVIYSCDDELNKQFNRKSLEKALYDAGAFFVSEIRPSKILTTTDKRAMNENDSVLDNLKDWLKSNDVETEKALKIIEIAEPLIAEVAASMPTGKLSGIFEPLSLEVKNYRSYREESFDFSKISFATVNGPNGIGKSSFFMDAIADCLYEEPREGELTGWISNNEDARSGMIDFQFLMGADKWRVVRTRAKSGKTTLALQRWNEDKWEDHSADKKDDTQGKIVNLLGMDSMTFKSCALIMQDNYGLFLEADKTDRMQVLGNILGLSIYDKLHELVKDKLRIHNREVEKLKSEIDILEDKLKDKDATEETLKGYEQEKKLTEASIKAEEEKIKNLEKDLQQFNILDIKIKVITDKITNLNKSTEDKTVELLNLKMDHEKAQKIVDQESVILEKIKEYEEAKTEVTTLKAQEPILSQKRAELINTKSEAVGIRYKINSFDKVVEVLKRELEDKDRLQGEVANLTELESQLTVLEEKKTKDQELLQKASDLKQRMQLTKTTLDSGFDALNKELKDCQKKAELIENSNCPVDNPSCNFLKDALEAKNKIPELEKKVRDYDYTTLKTATDNFENAKNELKNSGYSGKLHAEIRDRVQALRKSKEKLLSLSGKDELLKNNLQQLGDLRKNLEELQDKKSELTKEIEVLEVQINNLYELERKLPELEHWNKGKDELPAAKQLLATTGERIVALNNEIHEAEISLKSFKSERNNLADERTELETSEYYLQKAKKSIDSFRNELGNINTNIGGCQSRLEDYSKYEAEKKENAGKLEELAKTTTMINILVQAFSINGIPFQIVRSVVSELSAKSNEILSQMTGGKMSIEFKMDKVLKNKKEVNALEIWINDYQRGTMPYLSRSGGQKVKAALSVAFALADLKANRAGIQLGMLFVDEPSFLDSEGVQAYVDSLELLNNTHPGMKVIAISHDLTFKARFPQHIDVIDTGDQGSKIVFNE